MANKQIEMTAQARAQLATGDVDSRILILLPALAAVHPVKILAFGDRGPEASPGIPLCSAELSGSGRAASMTDASYLNWLVDSVHAQARLSPEARQFCDRAASPFAVEFSRPSPLGLLSQG